MSQMDLTQEQKLNILKMVYQQLHVSRRDVASFENKLAFSFSTLFLVFTALVLKGAFKLENSSVIAAVIFIALATVLAIFFLVQNGKLIRVICRMIVRIEQIVGLHADNVYITKEQVAKLADVPFPEACVFPQNVQTWGMSTKWQSLTPHIFTVICSGVAAILAVYFAK